MEFKDYLNAVRRHWPTWVAATVLGVVLAAGLLQLSTPKYEARAQVFVASSSTGTSQIVGQRVKSYPDVASTRAVLGPVISRLELDAPFAEVRRQVSASNPVDTSQIVITASSSSPQQAASLANAVAEEFTQVVEELESTDAGPSPVSLTVTDPATEPASPSGPATTYVLALGFVVGLLLGLALAIVRSRTSTALHDESDVRAVVDDGVPVLTAPRGRARRSPLAGSPAGALARRLELMAEERPVRIMLLSPSSAPAERRAAGQFAAAVVEELRTRDVTSTAGDHDPDGVDQIHSADVRVRIDVGDPLAPLRTWRGVARETAGVVLVLRSGRVAAAELREVRNVLGTADIQTLAVVVLPRHGNRSTRAAVPSATTPVSQGAGAQDGTEVTPERIAARPGPPVRYKPATQGQKARR